MIKSASKIIKNFDGYGKAVTLNINGKDSIHSFCGGFFSLVNLFFLIVILLINFYNFAFTPTALITVSEYFRPQREMQTISSENFMLANFFFLIIPGTAPNPITALPEKSGGNIYNFKMQNASVNYIKTHFGKLSDCEANSLYTENADFFSLYNRTKSLSEQKFITCFNFNESINFTVGGDIITASELMKIMVESEYNLFKFMAKPANCSLAASDFRMLSQVKMMTIIKNNYIDKDTKDGYSDFFQTFISDVDFTNDLTVLLKARRVNITTDNNLLYNLNPNVETETVVYSSETIITPRKGNSTTFVLMHEIVLDSYTTVIERSYLKLDGMLANVGSIVMIIEFLAKFFAGFLVKGIWSILFTRRFFILK